MYKYPVSAPNGIAPLNSNGNIDNVFTPDQGRYQSQFGFDISTFSQSGLNSSGQVDLNSGSTALRTVKTITANGNAQISTAQYKVGTSSGLFDGTGDYLSIPDSEDWNFGTGDFTFSQYVNFTALPTNGNWMTFAGQRTDANNFFHAFIYNNAGTYALKFTSDNASTVVVAAVNITTPTLGTWYHIEICRYGNNIKFFINGIQQGTDQSFNATLVNSTGLFSVGTLIGVSADFNGYIDELSISKGIARHTSNFTPITTPLANDSYTVLLLHFEGVNASTTFTDDNFSSLSGTVTQTYSPSDLKTWGNLKWAQTTPTNSTITTNVYGKNDSGTAQTTSTSYTSKSFSIASQDTAFNGLFFSSDGTKMYIAGNINHTIYQYTLSTGWDVSTASYASKSFSVAAQTTSLGAIAFNLDGTKMYVGGVSDHYVYQYTLSTGWDVSTASYASKSFSVGTQETLLRNIFFNSDGTKLYVIGDTHYIYQYTLSTGWDVSTASYASKSFNVGTQDTQSDGIFFNADGTKLFMIGTVNNTIYQYTLSTGWDVSTASYASKSFSVAAQDTTVRDIYYSSNGINIYIAGDNNNTVYQYITPISFDLASNNSIILKSGSSAIDSYYNTYLVKITGGTGVNQSRIISNYIGSTKVATVTSAWTTIPDTTSTYSLYVLLNSGIKTTFDLSSISISTYTELAACWTLSRNSVGDTTPTLYNTSLTWEGSSPSWIKIIDTTLSANAAQVDISNLSNFRAFKILIKGISSTSTARDITLRFNSDSGANFSKQHISGANTTVAAVQATGATGILLVGLLPSNTATDFSVGEILINNQAIAQKKTVQFNYTNFVSSAPNSYTGGGSWNNTTALISTISLIASADNLGIGTNIIVMGVK